MLARTCDWCLTLITSRQWLELATALATYSERSDISGNLGVNYNHETNKRYDLCPGCEKALVSLIEYRSTPPAIEGHVEEE